MIKFCIVVSAIFCAAPALAAPATATKTAAPVTATRTAAPATVDVNNADAPTLAKQLKISLEDAQKLVTARAKAPFKTYKDAHDVPGLSSGAQAALAHYGGVATLQPRDKAKIRALIDD